MDWVPPKEFAEYAGKKVHVPEVRSGRFRNKCDVDKRRIALERRFDRITCVECRPLQTKECAEEITCMQCHTPKPLCGYPETVEEIVARRHNNVSNVSSRMVCQSCKDELSYHLCSECDVRKPRDKMACKKGTNNQ